MSNGGLGSYESAIFRDLKCIPVSPWAGEVECLDILSKVKADEAGFLRRVFRSGHSEAQQPVNLVRQGSMMHKSLARDMSAWRQDHDAIRKGLDQLKNPKPSVKPRAVQGFKKETLPSVRFACKSSKQLTALLSAGFSSINGISADESLTFTLDGLTAASVPHEMIIDWTDGGEGTWLPNIHRPGLPWSTKSGSVNSIWIVTGVVYATKMAVAGQDGVFAGVKVGVPIAGVVPGVTANVSAGLKLKKERDNQLVVEAPRNQHFRVGYRAMRLDYNPDGTPGTVDLKYTGFRGEDDDLVQKHLKRMEEELFVFDEDGLMASIPLLIPSEAELNQLEASVEAATE